MLPEGSEHERQVVQQRPLAVAVPRLPLDCEGLLEPRPRFLLIPRVEGRDA